MKNLIITVHGIHTSIDKGWQKKFKKWTKKNYPEIEVINYSYGFLLAPFSWWIVLTRKFKIPSFLRRYFITKLVKFIYKVKKQYPDYKVSIISHSFGTWLSYYALNREPMLKIHNFILVQGVISSHVEKLDILSWLSRGKVNAVFAWSSHNDSIVCKVAIPPFGKVGCRGFVRKRIKTDYIKPVVQPYPEFQLYNRYTKNNHSTIWKKEMSWHFLIGQAKIEDKETFINVKIKDNK